MVLCCMPVCAWMCLASPNPPLPCAPLIYLDWLHCAPPASFRAMRVPYEAACAMLFLTVSYYVSRCLFDEHAPIERKFCLRYLQHANDIILTSI